MREMVGREWVDRGPQKAPGGARTATAGLGGPIVDTRVPHHRCGYDGYRCTTHRGVLGTCKDAAKSDAAQAKRT